MISSDTSLVPSAAYIHIPFCLSKCHYCDFSSFVGMEPLFEDYVSALSAEIARSHAAASPPLGSVYFGGGTPTILSAGQLERVLEAVRGTLGISTDAEVTVEANPGTVDAPKLVQLNSAGPNRISIGIQSLDDKLLARIGRIHTASDAVEVCKAARAAGFENLGIDLMFALPGQTLDHWAQTLARAIDLGAEHISLYELSVEEGTGFARQCASGSLELPDENTQVDMYELAMRTLIQSGYEHYEVSNFALPGRRSRHNQVYWHNEPYYGFGAGATSYLRGVRARRLADPRHYVDAISRGSDAIESWERLLGRDLAAETMILGLRMLEGVDISRVEAQTGVDVGQEFAAQIRDLASRGLVEARGGRLKVTHKGLLLLNDVSAELLG